MQHRHVSPSLSGIQKGKERERTEVKVIFLRRYNCRFGRLGHNTGPYSPARHTKRRLAKQRKKEREMNIKGDRIFLFFLGRMLN